MIIETTYSREELYKGKCSSCGEWSTTLLKGDSRCIDCIEADKFYEETMKIKDNEIRD